ncbi:MAG TPA: OB-fold nucleic acid binding domain-containing protein, partial [Candidatus Binatia bacterium]
LFGLGTTATGFAGASNGGGHHDVYPMVEEWSPQQKLIHEKESLGFYITGHPLDKYESRLSRLTSGPISDLRERPVSGEVKAGGVTTAMRLRNTKKGDRYASFQLEDKTGFIEVIVWPDTYKRVMDVLSSDDPILVSGKMDVGEERVQIIANGVIPLEQAAQKLSPSAGLERRRQEASARVHFYLLGGGFTPEELGQLHETLRKYPGSSPVFLHLTQADNSEAIIEPENLRVASGPELLQTIEQLFGSRVTVSPLPS